MLANVVAVRSWVDLFAPGLLMLCIAIGGALLWRRTRRSSVLVQLVAASLLFADWGLTEIFRALDPNAGPATFFWSERIQTVRHIIVSLALVAFPISYLWYALTEKASNHAMQRTPTRRSPQISHD